MIRNTLFAIPFVLAAPLAADTAIMSAPDALSAVTSGEMILIDIRSPAEWDETGVAEGAIAMTMHNPAFPKQINALLTAQTGKSIGLICATGGRTAYVVSFLAKNGFGDVIDVSEGMMGNARGPGWIARGLPLTTSEAAQAAYQAIALPQ